MDARMHAYIALCLATGIRTEEARALLLIADYSHLRRCVRSLIQPPPEHPAMKIRRRRAVGRADQVRWNDTVAHGPWVLTPMYRN
jgi:hypothetical protein